MNIAPITPRQLAPSASPGTNLLRRIGASIPRQWIPIARRGLFGVAAHLPARLQYRLNRLVGVIHPDMHGIERHYQVWIEQFDRIDGHARLRILQEIDRMENPPLISVLMPVFNPPPKHLLAAIRSVQDQLYPHWELCIADDASTDPAAARVLHEAAASDHRVKLIRREQNGHISAASNSALTLATGLFVALLDHDDILPPHALFEVARRIVAQPDVDIVYSDEDHIDNEGRRSHPYFKPDWNPDLVLGQNLISHLGVYRRSLMEKIGGFQVGLEGSQDHDLALRVVAETTVERIAHIPKVLYHWRQGSSDRTFSEAAQARCVANGRKAIQAFVDKQQPGAKVEPARFVASWTRVVYPVPEQPPLVSIIISDLGSTDLVLHCIDGILRQTDYPAVEILLAGPLTPALGSNVVNDKRVRRLGDSGTSVNGAVSMAYGDLILLLDPALEASEPGWLTELVSQALRAEIGAVGAKVLSPEDRILHAGMVLGTDRIAFTPFLGSQRRQIGYFAHLQLTRSVTAVSGGCLMVRRQAYLEVGGRDEGLMPVLADIDLCLKLEEAGLRNLWTPYAELHRRTAASNHDMTETKTFIRDAASMRQRWGERLTRDRYWNPNLLSHPYDVTLAFPPYDSANPMREAA